MRSEAQGDVAARLAVAFSESPAWPAVFGADSARLLAEVALAFLGDEHERRTTELLAANNRYLSRARRAEACLERIARREELSGDGRASIAEVLADRLRSPEPLHAHMSELFDRRGEVETVLRDVFRGRRGPLSREQCWELANRLSIPREFGQGRG